MLFINCGGYFDLANTWLSENDQVKSYLVDSHRPYNHLNLNHKNIYAVDDGCPSFDDCPNQEETEAYQHWVDNVDSEEEEDSDNYSDMDEAKQELQDLQDGEDEDGAPEEGADPEGS